MYTFFFTLEDIQDIGHSITAHYAEALATPTLDTIPPEWLHLTVQGVGFTDEVSTEEITELLEELQQRCASFPSVEMTVGSPIVAEEGVVLEVDPLDDARKLRHRVRTVLTEVRDPNKLDGGDAYTPHLTLAYSNSEGPAARVIERLDPLPSLPAKLTFNRLSLVSLGRDNQMYEWDVIGCVPLSG